MSIIKFDVEVVVTSFMHSGVIVDCVIRKSKNYKVLMMQRCFHRAKKMLSKWAFSGIILL